MDVSVRTRAPRCRVAGVRGGRLRVDVTAAPERGKATSQVLRTLAEAAGVPREDVTLLKGASVPRKTLLVRGLDPAECRRRLGIEREDG